MAQEAIDKDLIRNDFDRRIRNAVADWTGDLEDYHGLSVEDAEAEVADVLQRWIDERSASDWF